MKSDAVLHFGAFTEENSPLRDPLTTVKRAKDVKPEWFHKQKEGDMTQHFANCPGMHDLMNYGYLIPAWTDIKIIQTKQEVTIMYSDLSQRKPTKMNHNLLRGAVTTKGVPFSIQRLPGPWYIKAVPGWSVILQAPFFHNPKLQDLVVYPGITDNDTFYTTNFIFSCRTECEIEIKKGEPILHVIPFKREHVPATVGSVTEEMAKFARAEDFKHDDRERAYYRKHYHTQKTFDLEEAPKCPYHHKLHFGQE